MQIFAIFRGVLILSILIIKTKAIKYAPSHQSIQFQKKKEQLGDRK